MPKRSRKLTDAQLEIMNVVWELGECTVTDVQNQLSQLRDVARNTVLTTLSRLEDNGWLRHREERGRFLYSASVSREKVQKECLDGVVKTVFDGSAEGLVAALLQNRSLSRAEASRIRSMIQDAEKRS